MTDNTFLRRVQHKWRSFEASLPLFLNDTDRMQRENAQTEVEEDRRQKAVKRLGVSAQPGPLELLTGMLRMQLDAEEADGC